MKKITITGLLCLITLIFSTQALAKFTYTKSSFWGGVDYALSGYDATAYFLKNAPEKGSTDHAFEYRGATWLFSSKKTKTLFVNNPQKYAPQYGGHCAWREAQDGEEVYGDPTIWTMVDGKLYLNYNEPVNQLWIKDIPGFIIKADEYWLKEFDTLN